jgi:hypothetical protein
MIVAEWCLPKILLVPEICGSPVFILLIGFFVWLTLVFLQFSIPVWLVIGVAQIIGYVAGAFSGSNDPAPAVPTYDQKDSTQDRGTEAVARSQSVEERLARLGQMRESGLISEAEYTEQRQRLLADI